MGGAVTGKGADVLIIDDPHSEQEARQNNPAVLIVFMSGIRPARASVYSRVGLLSL